MANKKKINNYKGLTQEEVSKRLEKFGYNTVKTQTNKSFITYLKEALKDITIIILLFATILSSYVAFQTHPDDFTEPIVIFSIVILNIYLSIKQQKDAEKSMNELKQMNTPTSQVLRDGEVVEVKSSEIVPGDILQLNLGDRVPADAQILNCNNFFVDESF
ncbi:hypothetical protein GCM10025857_58860 [Alicyclobacillus contaminans]|nr:hypothetical protein GCM10025857_58860 [Alicyclobacillus contaminans]